MPDKIPDTVDAYTDTHAPQEPPPPPLPPAIKGHENGEGGDDEGGSKDVGQHTKEPPHWTTYVGAALTLALVLITAAYTVYAHRQWVAISGQLSEMHDSRAAAQTAAALTLGEMQRNDASTADQFQAQSKKLDKSITEASRLATATEKANANVIDADRPWVGILVALDKPEVGKNMTYTLTMENTGKSPALMDIARITGAILFDVPSDPNTLFAYAGNTDNASKSLIMPGGNFKITGKSFAPPTPEQIESIKSGALVFVAFAKVEYRDMRTNKTYWTHTCERFNPNSEENNQSPYQACKEYQDAK